VLDALNADNEKDMRSILESAILATSQHWQERAIAAGIAEPDDFFYDTYMGANPDLLKMNKNG
tara:strand:+ start:517 stop:705 length:189 start_codon:yes stop_codon:yes gene_type:complete